MTKVIETLDTSVLQSLVMALASNPQAQALISASVDANGVVQTPSVQPANADRLAAIGQIEPLSFKGARDRKAEIDNLTLALGDSPTKDDIADARKRWITGQLAVDLPDAERPAAWLNGDGVCVVNDATRLDWCRQQVYDFVAPPTGKAARTLKKGKLGYRSESVNRLIRNAEERFSKLLAETGFGLAQTRAEKLEQERKAAEALKKSNDERKRLAEVEKNRAPQMAGSSDKTDTSEADASEDDTPVNGETDAEREWDADSLVNHFATQAASMLALANAQAKVCPTDAGMAVRAFSTAILKAKGAQQTRREIAEAADKASTIAPGNLPKAESATRSRRIRKAK